MNYIIYTVGSACKFVWLRIRLYSTVQLVFAKIMSNFSIFFLLVVLLHALSVGDGTLSKSSKKKGKKNGSKEASVSHVMNKLVVSGGWLTAG